MNLFLTQCVSTVLTSMCVKSYLEIRKWWYKDYHFNGGHLYSVKVVISYYYSEVSQPIMRSEESFLSL